MLKVFIYQCSVFINNPEQFWHENITFSFFISKMSQTTVSRCSVKKGFLTCFTKFSRKHLCQSSSFSKIRDLSYHSFFIEKLEQFWTTVCEVKAICKLYLLPQRQQKMGAWMIYWFLLFLFFIFVIFLLQRTHLIYWMFGCEVFQSGEWSVDHI